MTQATQNLATQNQATQNQGAIVNGIDLEQLRGAIDAISADPDKGLTGWKVRSDWMGGTRSDHHVQGCSIGGEFIERPFTIKVDEPHELCGDNQYANPQEYLLSALNACMIVGYAAVAGLMGVRLTRLEIETTGDIDLRGFLGIDPAVPNGYTRLEQTVRIEGDGSDEQMRQLHEAVQNTSPNFFNITRAVQVDSRLRVG